MDVHSFKLTDADVDGRYNSLVEPCCWGRVEPVEDFVNTGISSNRVTVDVALVSTNP